MIVDQVLLLLVHWSTRLLNTIGPLGFNTIAAIEVTTTNQPQEEEEEEEEEEEKSGGFPGQSVNNYLKVILPQLIIDCRVFEIPTIQYNYLVPNL